MASHVHARHVPRGPVAKPTGLLTSCRAACSELSRRCNGNHEYIALVGGRAAVAQVKSPARCAAMCRGKAKPKAWDAWGVTREGRMDSKQLCCLIGRIVDPSVTSELRRHSQSRPAARPRGNWLLNWVDDMHELEVGKDTIGGNMRVGVEEMKKYMDPLHDQHGAPQVWHDMHGYFWMQLKSRKQVLMWSSEEDKGCQHQDRRRTVLCRRLLGRGGWLLLSL